jgi:DNA-binding NtrC family response regulator
VLPLARHFLLKWNAELGRGLTGWTEEVEAFLLRHDWPGNVRELENAIERGVVLARGERIALEDLLLRDEPGADAAPSDDDESPSGASGLQSFLDRAAAEHVRAAIAAAAGVRAEAARRLGIDRSTLYRLMRKYGIE